jgi:hypothetical protein
MFFHPPTGRVFNSLISLKNLMMCDFFTNPIFQLKLLDLGSCDKYLPKFCHKCPYVVGESPAANITIIPIYCPLNKNITQKPVLERGVWFPDGDYKVVYTLRSNITEMTLKYFYRVKIGDSSVF